MTNNTTNSITENGKLWWYKVKNKQRIGRWSLKNTALPIFNMQCFKEPGYSPPGNTVHCWVHIQITLPLMKRFELNFPKAWRSNSHAWRLNSPLRYNRLAACQKSGGVSHTKRFYRWSHAQIQTGFYSHGFPAACGHSLRIYTDYGRLSIPGYLPIGGSVWFLQKARERFEPFPCLIVSSQ